MSEVGYSTHAYRKMGHEVLPVERGGTEQKLVNTHISAISRQSSKLTGIKKLLPLWFWNALKDLRLMKHDVEAGKRLEKAILEFKPDLIYERGEYLQDSGVKMAAKHGTKHVLEVNSPVVEEMSAFEGPDLLRFLGHNKERKKLNCTSHVIAVSSALKEYLQTFYNCKKPIHIAPNAINLEKDKFDPEAVKQIRGAFSDGAQIIGFVGSLFPYHGVDGLIEAFAGVIQQQPNRGGWQHPRGFANQGRKRAADRIIHLHRESATCLRYELHQGL